MRKAEQTTKRKEKKRKAEQNKGRKKDSIYQNGRGHSASGSGGEIVTLSPGIGSLSLEVLRGCGA